MNLTAIRLSLVLSVLFLFSCKKTNENIIHLNKENFTPEEEMVIGSIIKEEILKYPEEIKILDRNEYASAHSYVETLMNMLLNTDAVKLRNTYNWDLTIMHDDQLRNAFITPGGHLFVSTGLLKFIRSESELVSILGHEIYYADKGYVVKRLKQDYSDLADLLLDKEEHAFLKDLALDMNNISFATVEVKKADQYAIDLLCPFQYDAMGIKTFLESAENSTTNVTWLKTRPGDDNRKEEIRSLAQDCGAEESTFADRYHAFKTKLLPQ